MHCNVREPCSACRLPFQIENQIGIRDCFDICHSSMQKVLSRLACISVSFFIFVIKSTGCPKKNCTRFCGCCGGTIDLIISVVTQLHTSGFKWESEILYKSI